MNFQFTEATSYCVLGGMLYVIVFAFACVCECSGILSKMSAQMQTKQPQPVSEVKIDFNFFQYFGVGNPIYDLYYPDPPWFFVWETEM